MLDWLYRWLPIIFGCHCRSDRSFFYKRKQFPLCARCTGELAGIILSPIFLFLFGISKWYIYLILMLPMIIDGFLQQLTDYESGNIRRVITGFLFGTALAMLFISSTEFTIKVAFQLGREMV